jgi:hypothetical protein
MIKNRLLVLTLMSVALWTGCATGGGGHTGGNIQVAVDTVPGSQNFVGVTLTVQFKATVTGTSDQAVTWSISGTGCTGNACGTINSSGLYTAPTSAPSGGLPLVVTATLISSPTKTGTFDLTVLPIVVIVTPKLSNGNPVNVAKGVQQQFTAIVTPDAELQTVTWSLTCDAGGNACGTIDAGTGLFTAANSVPAPATGHVTATSTLDPSASETVDLTIVASRLAGNSTYVFHLSGFDSSGQIAAAGRFTTNSDGTAITAGGTEDDLTVTQHSLVSIDSGGLALDNNDHGTLTLNTSAGTRKYKLVLHADGDGRLIEFDNVRRGSGEFAQTKTKFKNSALPAGSAFVFGMTGLDTVLRRTGIAGQFKPDGAGAISSGLLDVNNGTPTSSTNVTGTYDLDTTADGRGPMTLTDNSTGKTYNYAIYMVGGQTSKDLNPLTLYVISTDDPQVSPAVSGTIVFQDPTPKYLNADFKDFWIASLTGVNSQGHSLVSLTNGAGDGNGHLSATYYANNAGIVPAKPIDLTNYVYASTGGGRYTLDLLGNPAASPVVPPVHFVLYSSAASRGFLLSLDPTVYTGTMDQQPGSNFAASELAGSFAAATVNSSTAGASQTAANILFKSVVPDSTLTGKRDETDGGQFAGQSLTGTYSVDNFTGAGTLVLTQPGPENYVIYVLDNSDKKTESMSQRFVMINVDSTNSDPSIIFGER